MRFGVYLGADGSILEDVTYKFDASTDVAKKEKQIGVRITGSRNTVKEVKCQGFELVKSYKDKFSVEFKSQNQVEPSYNVLTTCGPGRVVLRGQHNCLNLVTSDLIILSGHGHKLNNCFALQCDNQSCTGVELIDCNFSL